MLKFSEAQMDKMADESFLERMISIIAESYPGSDAEELRSPDGRRVLREQLAKARQYDLSTELELGQYIMTAWLLGTDFDTRFPAMHEILTHPKMSPSQRAQAIEQTATMLLEMLTSGRP